MSNPHRIPHKRAGGVCCALTAILILYSGSIVFGENGFLDVRRMRANLAQIQSENTAIGEKNRSLSRSVHRLKNDPDYIEHIIRQQLQMNAPGEIIFRFDERPSSPAPR